MVVLYITKSSKVTKNRPKMSGCKLWLFSVCSSRAELLEIGRDVDKVKKYLTIEK